jgi:hypothetical protein
MNKGVNENKQLDTVTKMWLAIWVTSTSYFHPIDYFVTLAGTVGFFQDVVCAVC